MIHLVNVLLMAVGPLLVVAPMAAIARKSFGGWAW